MNRNEYANRAANEMATVLTRLLDVADRDPALFDDSTADDPKSRYQADALDAIDWALEAFENAIKALPGSDVQKPHMLDWLRGYQERRDRLSHPHTEQTVEMRYNRSLGLNQAWLVGCRVCGDKRTGATDERTGRIYAADHNREQVA